MGPTAGPGITRISPQPEPSTQEVLAGLVERVTYHNAENGFCVLRARARGHRDVVTVVGHVATISAGEWITASGEWVNDRTHGQQFKARFLRTSPPTSADGIEKYLSSGMIRGVGPVYAKKLVRAFGETVFDVIETSPTGCARFHDEYATPSPRALRTPRGWPAPCSNTSLTPSSAMSRPHGLSKAHEGTARRAGRHPAQHQKICDASDRVRASAESDQKNSVTGLVVIDDELVAVSDIPRDPAARD